MKKFTSASSTRPVKDLSSAVTVPVVLVLPPSAACALVALSVAACKIDSETLPAVALPQTSVTQARILLTLKLRVLRRKIDHETR
jgi:hypothetical protein